MPDLTKLVSVDDHVVEPQTLFIDRLPAAYQDRAPRVVRERGRVALRDGDIGYERDEEAPWADVWHYEDVRVPMMVPFAAAGFAVEDRTMRAMTYDEMRPGCYEKAARLADMDMAGIEASLCFPNQFVRFCGQRFLHAKDKDLALLCVKAYNDFILDDWCHDTNGRLIPSGIIPLWDVDLAVAELRRCAGKGMRAVSFSEIPPFLDLPSIHSGYWEPFFRECDENRITIMMHIGSSSKLLTTSADAPAGVLNTVQTVNSTMALADWLFSGALVRHPSLRLVLAESQIGWIPFYLNRADEVWEHNRGFNEVYDKIPEPPSTYFDGRIACAFFNDAFGLQNVEAIGADNVMFETDYPHSDTYWPDSAKIADKQTSNLSVEDRDKVLRGNARRILGLD